MRYCKNFLQSLVYLIPIVKAASPSEAQILQFDNVGYLGTYRHVGSFEDIYSDECSCSLVEEPVSFSGVNSPLDQELSVHFRGPLSLSKFAYYVSSDFSIESEDNEDWSRLAYYDAEEGLAENVTFLTTAGRNSSCLGRALTYADSDGLSEADSPTILDADTVLDSEQEFSIFSNVSCEDSGVNNDCGVYRDGIPAYHGYYGATKMFLFEFTMPQESTVERDSVYNWDMPAIWLLNAHIPRTSQYSLNANCSCWRSGCGEFDIFEVKNYTSSEVNKLYTTIHDYQGTDDIETGLQINGYFDRDTSGIMRGGVIFDNDGSIVTFMSNSTSFDSSLTGSSISSLISNLDTDVTTALASVGESSSGSTDSSESSSRDSSASKMTGIGSLIFSVLTFLLF